MSGALFKISGGVVYDPANDVNGEVRDVYFADGVIVSPPEPQPPVAQEWDADGLVIMPGGVDMHSHIAGGKVNAARKLTSAERTLQVVPAGALTRSGTLGFVPSTFATGYKYLALGYTTAMDAAIPPLGARQAHQELRDTPCIDKGFFILAGNNEIVLQRIADQDPQGLDAFLGWLVASTGGYAVKLVNPGGVAAWRHAPSGNVRDLDDKVPSLGVTPRSIIRELSASIQRLQLPHAAHIHCNQLGMPGNWTTTLETMQALEGHRAHLTHIQFHSYGGGTDVQGEAESEFCSQVQPLADYVNEHDHLTIDVGQVMFDKTVSMTADSPTAHYLANLYGSALYSCDVECEAGCGVSPIEYKRKSLVNAWQWAIGLEWFLSIGDPWKIAMSTDHPNGGSFLSYPQVIRLLMDRDYRRTALERVHPKVREQSPLRDLDREYTLSDIAIITRAAPARMLGLANKGHLGPGADADITIYAPQANQEAMFALPKYVFKSGQLLAEDGEIRGVCSGQIMSSPAIFDGGYERRIKGWFEDQYSIEFENFGVG